MTQSKYIRDLLHKTHMAEAHSIFYPMGAAVKLCLGDLLVMGSNPETASLHMQG